MPDVPVAAVLLDAIHDGLDRINLVRSHQEELLLALDEHHVAADHSPEFALLQEAVGEVVEMIDRLVVLVGETVHGEVTLVSIEGEVAGVVVGEIDRFGAIADDEKLDETEQRAGVAIAGVVLIFDDLLHRAPRIDGEGLEFHLGHRDTVDEKNDVVAVVAVVGVDAELVDDFEVVFAPVLDVHQGVGQRRAVVADEVVLLANDTGGGKDVRSDEFIEEPLEFAVGEADAV